jgi:pimeloyl-ACP methyl ester carboxylesterase
LAKRSGAVSRLVYLHGFASGPSSKKARYFAERFAELGMVIETPDLAAGDFEQLTITGQLEVIDKAVNGAPVSLMGSSLGGYLAALYAARHPEVERVVLMAPAFCFGRRWAEEVGTQRMLEWKRTGSLPIYHYSEGGIRGLGYQIVEDAAGYEEYPDFHQPALIFHGSRDNVVPVELSREFVTGHPNATLRVVESGHELTDVMGEMWKEAKEFLLR